VAIPATEIRTVLEDAVAITEEEAGELDAIKREFPSNHAGVER
jgi:hypothetical protein